MLMKKFDGRRSEVECEESWEQTEDAVNVL
jgi:hypothetical protein